MSNRSSILEVGPWFHSLFAEMCEERCLGFCSMSARISLDFSCLLLHGIAVCSFSAALYALTMDSNPMLQNLSGFLGFLQHGSWFPCRFSCFLQLFRATCRFPCVGFPVGQMSGQSAILCAGVGEAKRAPRVHDKVVWCTFCAAQVLAGAKHRQKCMLWSAPLFGGARLESLPVHVCT